ncbi:GDP-mannose 4,6-dehydratase [Longimicrobium sp.]|uniref:GDP-mannose 4,6-dehydratase n=1 Tax=Longimicrobium sp. TaxID=2029185 RepID=UPI002F929561
MRVLVTGAAGFAGTWLVRALLEDGHTVVATRQEGHPSPADEGGVEWISLDVTSAESVEAAVARAAPEQVYHLAGQASVAGSFNDPLGTWDVNATGTLRLARALPADARLLLVSSAEVYGVVPEEEQPIREDRPLQPCNPYAASKAAAEMAALQARGPVVVARSFNHTGPGQDERFALASFARQLAEIRAGRGEPVLRVGNLSARRDLLDVRDVARAYVRLMNEGEAGQAYNVCSGHAAAMSDAVEQLIALSGTGARLELDPERVRPVDVPLLCGSGARLRALGWAPEIAFRDTLADLLESHVQAVRAGTAA